MYYLVRREREDEPDVLPERVSSSSRRYAPTASVVWVGPEQVTHRSFVRDLLDSIDRSDVVEGVDGWRETSVKAEDLNRKRARGTKMNG
jgi:hypothetical protein